MSDVEIMPIIAGTAATGWVIYMTWLEMIKGVQSEIARANSRLQVSMRVAELIAEDEKEEIETIINAEWNI